MIADFHSHVLPRIDDGSDSLETSLRMLRMAGKQGVEYMLATPHFYANSDTIPHFLRKRRESEAQLREAMSGETGLPSVAVGAEVYYFQGMSNSDDLRKLTLGESGYILVEMPFTAWTDKMYQELEKIHENLGLTPVIAHVERYFGRFSTCGIPERLRDMPVLVQSNAEFFLSRRSAGRALRLLDRGYIHLLGSDCHNLESRKPNLGQAAELIGRRLGNGALEYVENNGKMLLRELL